MNGPRSRKPLSPAETFQILREGNLRFQNNVRSIESLSTQARREELVAGQSPIAVVLSCSDSRAPAELLFDCGLGDLFVVRVAGNIVAPSLVGSVEFAVAKFGTPLVVVLGHTHCGAVRAALDALRQRGNQLTDNVNDIVDRMLPSITEIVTSGLPEAEVDRLAGRANVRVSAGHLRHGSRLLERAVEESRVVIVGAEYDIETGVVDFFDGLDRLADHERRHPSVPPKPGGEPSP